MSTQRQLRRGTTAEVNAATPAAGELVMDTTLNQLCLGNGSLAGGIKIPMDSYTTTATAAGTTTLTVGSTYNQYFTGATTQTVTLPVTSTLALGRAFKFVNQSSGAVTINSSGGNAVLVLAANTSAIIVCILLTGTTAASWSVDYMVAPQMATNTVKGNITGGTANAADLTFAQLWGAMKLGGMQFQATGVNFNSANTDTAIAITIPTGFTRYRISSINLSGASASLTTATCGVFPSAAGAGTAIVASGTVISVSSASENTNSNSQALTIVSGANISFTHTTIYFRVQNPQGSAATGNVIVNIQPLS
jgi:hypothetical protein